MNTYLLTWNPKKSPKDGPRLEQGGKDLAAGKPFVGRWRTGNRKDVQVGDRVFMQRQGNKNPGLIGSGTVVRGPQLEARTPSGTQQSLYCRVNWDHMLPDFELPKAELLKGILPENILKAASSGSQVPSELRAFLETHWATHLASSGRVVPAANPADPFGDPTPIADTAQFKNALLTLASEGLTTAQTALLRAQFLAPAHTITAQQLADALGYSSHGAANFQYGRLAHRIADFLHYQPGPFSDGAPHWWRTLASGNEGEPHNPEGHYEWTMRPELVAALKELGWFSPSGTIVPPRVSSLTFARQFARFGAQVRSHSGGQPFVSFRDGMPAKWEDYKEPLRTEALRRLSVRSWKSTEIGTGRILARVIQAIEISDRAKRLHNNLVDWPNRYGHAKRSHRALLDARTSAAQRRTFEQWFFDFYQNRLDDAAAFEQLLELAGTRYDLIAYLFFLKDSTRFMPIAPTTFDKAFQLLGVNLVTAHHCSWDNYTNYNAALGEVQQLLREVAQVSDAPLIDAHSFCWMLVRLPLVQAEPPVTIPLPTPAANIQPIAPPTPSSPATEHPVVEEDTFAERDEQRRRLGRLAQDIALQSERRRLREQGHPDPDQAVQPVWNRPTLGYDILSTEPDGSPRHIEVKAARKSADRLSFILSENERRQSRDLPNYHFYLVLTADSLSPEVLTVAALSLPAACLAPVNYRASLTVRSS